MNAKLLQIGGGVAMAAVVVATSAAWTWGRGGGEEAPRGSLITVAAAELDMTVEDLVAELHDGNTIAAIAEQRGVETDAIVQAALAPVSERLAQAVEDGRITEDEAAARLAQAETHIADRLAQTAPMGYGPGEMQGHGARGMGGHGHARSGMSGGPGWMGGFGMGDGHGFGHGTGECLAETPAA